MIELQSLVDRIRKIDLSEYEQEDASQIKGWITTIENAQAIQAVAEMDFIKDFLKTVRDEIHGINDLLINKREMETLERLNLLDRRDMLERFLGQFNLEATIKEITQVLDTL